MRRNSQGEAESTPGGAETRANRRWVFTSSRGFDDGGGEFMVLGQDRLQSVSVWQSSCLPNRTSERNGNVERDLPRGRKG